MLDIALSRKGFVAFILVLFLLIFVWFYPKTADVNGKPRKDQTSSIYQFLRWGTQSAPQFLSHRQAQTVSFIPSNDTLTNMTTKQLITLFHTYQDHMEFLCVDQKRLGTVFDGGKFVCLDKEFRPKFNDCLVYSFGSMNEYSFERDVIKWFGCEVHTFDPFMPGTSNKPAGCTLHKVGLGGSNKVLTSRNIQIKTLDQIMTDLGHSGRTLDMVKADIEEYEWEFMKQTIKSGLMSRKVKQYQVEIHYYGKTDRVKLLDTLGIFRDFYGAGFRIFSRERNTACKGCTYREQLIDTDVTEVTELAYVNERFVF